MFWKNQDEVYIIAEAGDQHFGSLDTAFKLVDGAKNAGANCIKFQTFAQRFCTHITNLIRS